MQHLYLQPPRCLRRPARFLEAVRGPLVTILCSVAFSALSFSTYAQKRPGRFRLSSARQQLIDLSGKSRPLERGAEVNRGPHRDRRRRAGTDEMTDGALLSVRTDTDVTVEKYRHNEKSAQDSGMLLKLARGALFHHRLDRRQQSRRLQGGDPRPPRSASAVPTMSRSSFRSPNPVKFRSVSPAPTTRSIRARRRSIPRSAISTSSPGRSASFP